MIIFFSVALRPNAGHGLPILEVSRSYTTTHHSRQDSSERVISSSQRPVPDNIQHSQQTNIHAPGGFRTHDISRRAAADLRLRPRGHWDRHNDTVLQQNSYIKSFSAQAILLEDNKLFNSLYRLYMFHMWAGQRSRYSDWLRDVRSGDRIPVGARFSAPVQTDPGAHPVSCTMGTGSFPGVKSGRSVTLTPPPLLVPWS